ncbi:MAG: hypothetical protein ORN83_07295 [Chthoniobacteraceae bacterium]|nr:hypothetical protein [Chthoniobacteraceae bacterium]
MIYRKIYDLKSSLGIRQWPAFYCMVVFLSVAVAACGESPVDRCVQSRLKVWDSNSEKTPWRISEATGQTRSDYEAKARNWCTQEERQ